EMGRMNPEELKKALDPSRPALIVYSMGTTFKGGIDDQAAINKIVDEANLPAVYRHVDAALFGGYLPFSEYKDLVDKRVCKYDSIAISGHKFFGVDEPCGLFFTTKEVMEHENPYEISYLNGSMPMINCSRSATNPLKLYWLMKTKGIEGFTAQSKDMLDNAKYLKSKLDEIGWPAWMSCEQSNTVFFKKPSDATMKKYFLAPDHDDRFGGDLAHVTVMQNASRDLIDELIADLKAEAEASDEQMKEAA
ncbi:MAG: pyridoxal-dependent decarboxylase, partial [Coriobacteriales bacterium]|nr:pyridoxal-dependent decarboxylase [Coriobacteriales bacterium]